MNINETAALGLTPNAARDSRKNPPGSYRKAAPHSTARHPRPRSLRALQRNGLLGVFLDLGSRP
jgi:hypothetical protein